MPLRALLAVVVFAVCGVPSVAAGTGQTIVVLGDSLSSGYGLGAAPSWVSILEDHVAAGAYGDTVVNASIAGDTTSGALSRLPGLLSRHKPDVVIIELGGNDGLRGQPVAQLKKNLASIIERVRDAGALPVLVGIQIPPNYGPAYTEQFARVYPELAAEYSIPFIPFLMDGVALDPARMQADRIHPNAAGQRPMFDNVWAVLADLL